MAGLLRPSGLLTIIEPAGPIRVTTADIDDQQAHMWRQLEVAWKSWSRDRWGDDPAADAVNLNRAGLEVVASIELNTTLPRPLSKEARMYATKHLHGMRAILADSPTQPHFIASTSF